MRQNNDYQFGDWTNFGDCSVYGGQLWIKNATVDNTDDFAECVETLHYEALGENQVLVVCGSIYIPDDQQKVKSALDIIGKSPSQANWIDKALAFHAYGGSEKDTYGGETVVQLGSKVIENYLGDYQDADIVLHGNTNLRKYIRENFLN